MKSFHMIVKTNHDENRNNSAVIKSNVSSIVLQNNILNQLTTISLAESTRKYVLNYNSPKMSKYQNGMPMKK